MPLRKDITKPVEFDGFNKNDCQLNMNIKPVEFDGFNKNGFQLNENIKPVEFDGFRNEPDMTSQFRMKQT